MARKQVFVGPKTLEEIDEIIERIKSDWGNELAGLQDWQLEQMVGTILVAEKSSFADELKTHFVEKDGKLGIDCNGWSFSHNPKNAWGGFYRQEKFQKIGWILHLMRSTEGDRAEKFANYLLHHTWLHWEEQEHLWGYKSFATEYDEADARALAEKVKSAMGGYLKRMRVYRSEHSWMWRVEIETTRKVRMDKFKTEFRTRILA